VRFVVDATATAGMAIAISDATTVARRGSWGFVMTVSSGAAIRNSNFHRHVNYQQI
jgi:hypothetical protein